VSPIFDRQNVCNRLKKVENHCINETNIENLEDKKGLETSLNIAKQANIDNLIKLNNL
jgi:hypothetical protein